MKFSPEPKNPRAWTPNWIIGFVIAATYSLAFLLAPIYTIAAIVSFQFLTFKEAVIFSFPLLVSIIIPPIHAPKVLASLSPIATGYFQYDEVLEQSYDEIQAGLESGEQRNFLVCMQPHGVVSFTSFCMNIMQPPFHRRVKTAVATSVLYAPILKQLLGINGLISASKANLTRHLKTPGVDGCAILYVGGIAELFKCCREEERLFLSGRKGFIKLALRENVDIVPVYLFGNTSILSEWKSSILCELSRKTGVVLTYFWGKWALPIPRDEQLLVARGKPMGLPHIPDPSQNDIDYWHAKYCQEVKRLFDTYKEKLPNYKNKKLYID
jgi:hypothetical protein